MKLSFLSHDTDDLKKRLDTHIDGHEDLRDEVAYLREDIDDLKAKVSNLITLVTKGN